MCISVIDRKKSIHIDFGIIYNVNRLYHEPFLFRTNLRTEYGSRKVTMNFHGEIREVFCCIQKHCFVCNIQNGPKMTTAKQIDYFYLKAIFQIRKAPVIEVIMEFVSLRFLRREYSHVCTFKGERKEPFKDCINFLTLINYLDIKVFF